MPLRPGFQLLDRSAEGKLQTHRIAEAVPETHARLLRLYPMNRTSLSDAQACAPPSENRKRQFISADPCQSELFAVCLGR